MLDIESDRAHPKKRSRPFAAGVVPLLWGPPLAVALLIAAFSFAMGTGSWVFVALLAAYVLLNVGYSLHLKRKIALDVVLLASLYTLRVLAGGAAAQIEVSEWLLAFSVFLFTSLAFAKRYAELRRIETEGGRDVQGRGYSVQDCSIIESMGPASGYLAVLVLALYINSEQMKQLYSNVWPLWLICMLLFYWISRLWILARRGELSEDPVVFTIKDTNSIFVCACAVVLLVLAAQPWQIAFF